MKILVISDSHGHIANIKTVMGIAIKSDMKAVIHCGDWDNLETFDEALKFGLPIYSVLGNADVDPDLEDALRGNCKKFDPHLLSLEFEGKKIGVIHYASFQNEKLFDYRVIFSGHKHSKEEKMVNFTKFVRPGALINGINFVVYETITGELEFFNSNF